MNYFNAVKELVGGALSGPTFGPVSEFIFNDGQTPPTEEAIQEKLTALLSAEPMRLLREERNRRLVEVDWTQFRDVNLTNDSDWKTYRQELRDLPSTALPKIEKGILTNITWPTKPA